VAVGSYALYLANSGIDEPNAIFLGAAPELDIQTVPPIASKAVPTPDRTAISSSKWIIVLLQSELDIS